MIKKIVNLYENLNGETIKYLIVTLLFIAFPYLIKVIIFALGISENIKINDELKNGTFFTYAISLVAPIWYTIEILVNNKNIIIRN